MKTLQLRTLLPAVLATACATAAAQTAQPRTRGELLYTTHCIGCHTEQMHWRDKRQATDWDSLKAQVRQWQATQGLRWSEEDIAEVARHLNDTIYRYPQTSDRVSVGVPRKQANAE
ncbi:MAG TPA: cytochrome c [Burkholderiaceae bacterium]|nr:cytochrome c [Burkholderiaceae bacterium]